MDFRISSQINLTLDAPEIRQLKNELDIFFEHLDMCDFLPHVSTPKLRELQEALKEAGPWAKSS